MRKSLLNGTVLAAVALLSACGYFNSYYNAERRFAEAERAVQRGERETALSAYRSAIEKAAVTYRRHADSRWGDDALLLIGRSRFAVGEHQAARAALGRAIEHSEDAGLRGVASLYLGAALVALGHPDSAVSHLARGLAAVDDASQHHAFGRLWQGRALLALGRAEGWSDLEAVSGREDRLGLEAALELAAHAVTAGDSARAARSLAQLLTTRTSQVRADSTLALVAAARQRWGSAAVLGWLPARPGESWAVEPRTRVRIRRAELAAAAGDTVLALRELSATVQGAAGPTAAAGRRLAARWQLAQLRRVEDLPQVRAMLLPALPDVAAVADIRRLRTLELLVDRARDGQSAALFAAAELARDTLGAPRLARELFVAYADLAAGTVWAPKALLAALDLSHAEEREPLLARLETVRDNPYVAAVHGGGDAAAFAAAEDRLGRAIAAVGDDARAAALTGDVRVASAVTRLDSLRLSARSDSVRIRCGGMLDSLALRGVRSDSVRAACLRGDAENLTRYLAIDTLLLRPRTAADSARRTGRAARDTLLP